MFIVSKTQQASLNFEAQYTNDPQFREWLTAGHKGQGIDTSIEPNQVRIYEGKDGKVLGYIIIYGGKGCFVVQRANFQKFQKAIASYSQNPTKLCYRYTDEDGFEPQEDMNKIFEDPRAKAIKDQAKAMIRH